MCARVSTSLRKSIRSEVMSGDSSTTSAETRSFIAPRGCITSLSARTASANSSSNDGAETTTRTSAVCWSMRHIGASITSLPQFLLHCLDFPAKEIELGQKLLDLLRELASRRRSGRLARHRQFAPQLRSLQGREVGDFR